MISRTSTTLLAGLAEPGNERAWRRFYSRYTPMLLAYAKRRGASDADAQDMVAETLTVFVQKYRAGEYERSRGRLKHWLSGIAANKWLKIACRRTVASLDARDGLTGAPQTAEPAVDDGHDEAFEREWQLERVNEALDVLRRECDPDVYQAFDLYVLKRLPAEKVAALLGVTKNVVYISKTRVLKRLRDIIAELTEDED